MVQHGQGGVSRRGFLKGGIAALGTAAFATGIGVLPGCAPQRDMASTGAASDNVAEEQGIAFEVYDTDLLVIGGGNSATQAANYAYDLGATVMVVDKGPFQFSGAGGMNFDIGVWQLEGMKGQEAADGLAFGGSSLTNPEIAKRGIEYTEWDMVKYFRNNGVVSNERLPDGSILMAIGDANFGMNTQGGFMRVFADRLADRGVLVYDETMVTDLIVEDGALQGVVGVHIPTGTYRVFRCKAAISATGPSAAFCGWVSVAPRNTTGAGDNTADVDIAAYRHGETLACNEFFSWDTCAAWPDGIAFGFNLGFTCDPEVGDPDYMMDADGNHFSTGIVTRPEFFRACAQAMADGKANERDNFYFEMTEEHRTMMRTTYKRNIQFWQEKFGIDVFAQPIELALNGFEHSGAPRVDENLMCPAIKGLFNVRGADAFGEGSLGAQTAVSAARYAAVCARDYIGGADGGGETNWQQVADEIHRLEEIRTRTADDALRPVAVRRAIQKAGWAGIRPGGNAEQYATAVAEMERIITEDLPRQAVTNQTHVFNREWKMAVENYNLALTALATVKSMEMREESRAGFFRTDFPEADDEFWGKNYVGIRLGDDGTMIAEAVPCAQ